VPTWDSHWSRPAEFTAIPCYTVVKFTINGVWLGTDFSMLTGGRATSVSSAESCEVLG